VRNLLERSLWTGVQTALAIITVEGLTAFDASSLDILITAGVAAFIAALKVLSTERLGELGAYTE
jgi:hypothetical protein